jgi:4-diphosphocytidyl-2-C-methyl-D-erythritol kinase
VFQTISLRDRLSFYNRHDGRLLLYCDDPNIPVDGRNLVLRAAELIRQKAAEKDPKLALKLGATIRLKKKIPSGAGLGGGSSNAAVALIMLPKLWNIKSLPHKIIFELAAKIGSDVPYFLAGGTCLVAGRGEKVRRLKPLPKLHLVVIFPGVHVSTAWAYSRISLTLTKRHNYSKITARSFGLASGPGMIARLLHNDLETAVIPRHPAISRAKNDLLYAGAINSLMTGSGSAVFGIFEDWNSARKAWRLLSSRWPGCYLSESVART